MEEDSGEGPGTGEVDVFVPRCKVVEARYTSKESPYVVACIPSHCMVTSSASTNGVIHARHTISSEITEKRIRVERDERMEEESGE